MTWAQRFRMHRQLLKMRWWWHLRQSCSRSKSASSGKFGMISMVISLKLTSKKKRRRWQTIWSRHVSPSARTYSSRRSVGRSSRIRSPNSMRNKSCELFRKNGKKFPKKGTRRCMSTSRCVIGSSMTYFANTGSRSSMRPWNKGSSWASLMSHWRAPLHTRWAAANW